MIVNASVLVLNEDYVPLNICPVRRAVVLVWRGKAEVLENGRGDLHSATAAFSAPSVIRLLFLVRRPRPQRKLTRREVFLRDRYTCQYCGRQTRELTIDHVVPRHRGGRNVWDNVVSACKACNHRKAGRTPLEAGMTALHSPSPPRFTYYYVVPPFFKTQEEWSKYFPTLADHGRPS